MSKDSKTVKLNSNPYREGSQYFKGFARMRQGSYTKSEIAAVLKDDGAKANGPDAGAGVLLSSRKGVYGNWSGHGWFAYSEEVKTAAGQEQKYRLRVYETPQKKQVFIRKVGKEGKAGYVAGHVVYIDMTAKAAKKAAKATAKPTKTKATKVKATAKPTKVPATKVKATVKVTVKKPAKVELVKTAAPAVVETPAPVAVPVAAPAVAATPEIKTLAADIRAAKKPEATPTPAPAVAEVAAPAVTPDATTTTTA